MARLTIREKHTGMDILVLEEERLLSSKGFVDKDEMYKIMMHLAEKLADYEDKEESGLLKILPCPIGTVVHEPYKFCGEGAWEIDHHYLKLEDLDKIGKTVFVDENDANAYITEREAVEIKG